MHPALLLVSVALQADPLVGRATVIDGDTLEMRGQRIRLWGIEAPEEPAQRQRRTEPDLLASHAVSISVQVASVARIPLPDRRCAGGSSL